MTLVLVALIFWVSAWILNAKLADSALAETRVIKLLVPVIFGLTIIGVWELLVRGLKVPLVILPPPSLVIETASQNLEILWKSLKNKNWLEKKYLSLLNDNLKGFSNVADSTR